MTTSAVRLLHIEDSPGDARLVREALSESTTPCFTVQHVSRVADARILLQRERFDVILLDLSLPDAQGMEGVRSIVAAAPKVPLVVLTDQDDLGIAARVLEYGAQEYLLKQVTTPQILARALCYAQARKAIEMAHDRAVRALTHDMRNALNVITLYAGSLLQTPDLLELPPALHAILRQATRLDDLVDELHCLAEAQRSTAAGQADRGVLRRCSPLAADAA